MDQPTLHRLREQDRANLDALLAAINGARNALRRDECGDWTIIGSRGTIHACDGVFSVYIEGHSALASTHAKKQLHGICPVVSQDGDRESVLTFQRMPDADEAATLRQYVGLRQTRDVPPDRALHLSARHKGGSTRVHREDLPPGSQTPADGRRP